MKGLLVALVSLSALGWALGCEISPVVTAPFDSPGARYSDCERAAEEYCEHSLRAAAREMEACVAEHRFQCLSSKARASTTDPVSVNPSRRRIDPTGT